MSEVNILSIGADEDLFKSPNGNDWVELTADQIGAILRGHTLAIDTGGGEYTLFLSFDKDGDHE